MSTIRTQLQISAVTGVQGYIDLYPDEPIETTYAIANINNLSTPTSPGTANFIVPGTKLNNILFDEIFQIGSDSSFDPGKKCAAWVIVDGIPTFNNAILQLTGINVKNNTNDVVDYEVVIYNQTANFLSTISENYINQLNWSGLNHTWTFSSITNSWTATTSGQVSNLGYIYPLIDYGFDFDIGVMNNGLYESLSPFTSNTSNITGTLNQGVPVTQFFPATYARTIWDNIFTQNGFVSNITDRDFNNKFNTLIVPYNTSAGLVHGPAFTTGRTFYAALSANTTYTYNTFLPGKMQIPYPSGAAPFKDASIIQLNYNGLYGYENVPPVAAGFVYSSDTYSQQIFTVNLNFNFNITLSAWLNYIEPVFIVGIKRNGILGIHSTLSETITINSITPNPYIINNRNCQITTNIINLQPGDIVYGNWYFNIGSNSVVSDVSLTLNSGTTYWYNTVNTTAIPGTILDYQNMIPQNIKQIDFVNSIANMFNLYFEPDPYIANQINIATRDVYFSSGTIVDLSEKLDRSQDALETILSNQQAHRMVFSYAKDTDWYNANYYAIENLTYGQYNYVFDNQWTADDDTSVAPIFSPTPDANIFGASNQFVIPKMLAIDATTNQAYGYTNTNIRILQYNYRPLINSSDYWNFSGQTFTSYPYAGMLDDPFNSTFDLSFGTVPFVYYAGLSSITSNNLVNLYWNSYLNQIGDKDAKMITAYFYLTPLDILKFRYNMQVYVRGITSESGYYYIVNSIVYNPQSLAPSKVELIKLPYASTAFKNQQVYPKYVNPPVGPISTVVNGGSSTTNSPNSLSVGINNTLNQNSQGASITGINNEIGMSSPGSSILGGYQSYISPNAPLDGIFVGSNNTIDQNIANSAIVAGSNNFITSGANNTVIIAASGVTATQADTLYTDNIIVSSGGTINGIPIYLLNSGTTTGIQLSPVMAAINIFS